MNSTDARGLVSIQTLAAQKMYYGGRAERSRQALTEFSHNMSHQALNKDKDKLFIQFHKTAELIIELIFVMLDRNNKRLNIANVINYNINNEISDYQFTFDIPTETEIQNYMEDILKNKKNPTNTNPSLCSTTIINSERNRDSKK